MKKFIIAVALLITVPVSAQQQLPPPEAALQINAVIGQWAQALVQQNKVIEELKVQLDKAQARVKELEAKEQK